jgi:hypothetical protein
VIVAAVATSTGGVGEATAAGFDSARASVAGSRFPHAETAIANKSKTLPVRILVRFVI